MISVRQSTTAFTTERGAQMRSVAEYVANLGVVRDQLTQAATSTAISAYTRRTLAPVRSTARSASRAPRT